MEEKIVCSAILRNNNEENPVLCKRHGDGIWLKKQLYGEGTTLEQQGFWTSKNRFAHRGEALSIAKKAWQLKAVNQIDGEPIDYSKVSILYSEYLW